MKSLLKAGMVSGLAMMASVATSSTNDAHACGPDPYVGTICITGATFCPRDYKPLEGQLMQISDFTTTYAVTGTTYGGDGTTSFGLPDARGRELVHAGTGPGLNTIYRGEYTGFEVARVPSYYFPSHTHDIDFTKASESASASLIASSGPSIEHGPKDNYFGNTTTSSSATNYSSSSNTTLANGSVTATASMSSDTTGATGTSPESQVSLNAIGPQLGLLFCVAMDGLYPPRPN